MALRRACPGMEAACCPLSARLCVLLAHASSLSSTEGDLNKVISKKLLVLGSGLQRGAVTHEFNLTFRRNGLRLPARLLHAQRRAQPSRAGSAFFSFPDSKRFRGSKHILRG